MNEFDYWIINKLDVNIDINDLQEIEWFPRRPYDIYTCAIRLKTKPTYPPKTDGDIQYVCVGNYINIKISDHLVVEIVNSAVKGNAKFGIIQNLNYNILIEHTSLTPVYPINMATFRSSIIGNALLNYLLLHGAITHTHYLVSDNSRNVNLVMDFLSKNKNLFEGKSDHVCAWLYCIALNKIEKFKHINKLAQMFPKCDRIAQENKIINKHCSVRDYCNRCISGHLSTLGDAGIKIDILDYESEVLKNANFFIIEEKAYQKHLSNNGSSYLLSNTAYFSQLSSQSDYVFSVVSLRQQAVINDSLNLLKKDACTHIIPIYFNDVNSLIPSEAVDVIREGIFHSVDQYIEEVCNKFLIDKRIAYSALKLMYLSYDNSEEILLDYLTKTDIEEYVKIIKWLEIARSIVIIDNSIQTSDVWLAKHLICAYSAYSMDKKELPINTKDFKCKKIVNYIIKLIKVLTVSDRVNMHLFNSALKVINNGLSLLGI